MDIAKREDTWPRPMVPKIYQFCKKVVLRLSAHGDVIETQIKIIFVCISHKGCPSQSFSTNPVLCPGFTVGNLIDCTKVESAHKVRKLLFFIMWLLYLQLLGMQNRYRLILCEPPWSLHLNYSTSDEAWNDAHIVSTGVQLYYHTPRVPTSKNEMRIK